MTKNLSEIAEYISSKISLEANIALEELMLNVSPEKLIELLNFLRADSECQFTQLIDITGVDYPEREKRFDVVYNLLSVKQNKRIRIKIQTDENTPVPSVIQVFPNAVWYERETWDMYGIYFSHNPDLRRILTDYGFDGHPLRKDFPLTGFVELRYDNEQKSVVYSPVELPQAYRSFDFMSPWEGANYAIDKAKLMNKLEWSIEPAQENDWSGIWAIFKDVISRGDTYTYAPDISEEQAKNIWIINGSRGYVVKHGSNIVGTFVLRTNQPGFGNHVANAGYMVHKDYRGHGIASDMCRYSLKEAKKLGYDAMQFNFVVSSNKPAVQLWQKMGFEIVGTVPKAFRHNTLGLTDVYIMYRSLADV